MQWEKILDEEAFSVGLANMTDMGTPPDDESYVWLDAQMPQISSQAAVVEVTRTKQSHGASTAPSVGRVWHTVALRHKWHGQLPTFAHTDTPQLEGAQSLCGAFGGSTTMAYEAGTLTGTAANAVASTDNTGVLGCLLASRDGDVVTPLGFVEAFTGAGPYSYTLCEDGPVVLGEDKARASTRTWYPAVAASSKWALRVCGQAVEQDYRVYGGVLSRVTWTWDEDDCLWVEYSIVFYGGRAQSNQGGLKAITLFRSMEGVYERPGARVMLASNHLASQDNGTAVPAGTCAVRNLSVAVEWPHFVVRAPPNPSAPEGVCDVALRPPVTTASARVPRLPDWDSAGECLWQKLYRERGRVSLSVTQGNALGRVFGLRIGRAHITAYPDWEVIDGVVHDQLELRADHNDGDAAATGAGRKTVVLSLG